MYALAIKASRAPADPRKRALAKPAPVDREDAAWTAARLAQSVADSRLRTSMRATATIDDISARNRARERAERLIGDARKLSLARQEREADAALARRVAQPDTQAAVETVLRRAGRTALREPGSSGRVKIIDPKPRASRAPAGDPRKRALSKTEADKLRRRAYASEIGTTPQGLGRMISNRRNRQ